jgi:hypothetical protein
VDRIAAEVTQEVGMLFENQDSDPGSSQQQCQHHPGGAPSGDAATDRNLVNAHRVALPRERSSTSSTHHANWSRRRKGEFSYIGGGGA